MGASLRIVLFARGEAPIVTTAYRLVSSYGLPVDVFIDHRTGTDQLGLLAQNGVPYRIARNPEVFVAEGIMPDISRQVEDEWIWVLNADEWPSPGLVDSVLRAVHGASEDPSIKVVALPRRWVALGKDGRAVHSRHWRLARGDYQYRVFRHKEVKFRPQVHTSGFYFQTSEAIRLPKTAWLYHFDWVVHSFEARQRKLSRYESLVPGVQRRLKAYYLPELATWSHRFQREHGEEVQEAAKAFGAVASESTWADSGT